MKQERLTKAVKIGGFSHVKPVLIGGDNPIVIQTMWKDKLSFIDIESAAKKINFLDSIGCSLLRFAVPDLETAEVIGRLAEISAMPLCADIHFDFKIALRCMDFPVAKIRINPGNIGGKEKVRSVLKKAADKNIPIRIGVNAGSLPADLRQRVDEGMQPSLALVESAQREISIFEEFGFNNYLVSMKTTNIADNISANQILAQRTDAPLHIGVTEAGPLVAGTARNAAALQELLRKGIGDTIRVSLSDFMENEIIAAREIVKAAAQLSPENKRLKLGGVNIISCPRCGRAGFDTHGFTDRHLQRLYAVKKDITIAIMGCEVNGPVEAKHADIGITGAGDKVLIFKRGEIIKTINADDADSIFNEELDRL